MTDPDTGLPLEATPPPVGKYRVVKVAESLAMAEPVERAGQINRGDELEWVGVYGSHSTRAAIVSTQQVPQGTPTEAAPSSATPFENRVSTFEVSGLSAVPAAPAAPSPHSDAGRPVPSL